MTAGKTSAANAPSQSHQTHRAHAFRPRPSPGHGQTHHDWVKNASAQRVNTSAVIVESIRKEYPELHLTIVPAYSNNLLSYAAAGHANIASIDREQDRMSWREYLAPANRLHGGAGVLLDDVKFAKYMVDWKGKEFIMYLIDGLDGVEVFGHEIFQYLLSPSKEAVDRLLLESGQWHSVLHDEIYVYDQGKLGRPQYHNAKRKLTHRARLLGKERRTL